MRGPSQFRPLRDMAPFHTDTVASDPEARESVKEPVPKQRASKATAKAKPEAKEAEHAKDEEDAKSQKAGCVERMLFCFGGCFAKSCRTTHRG